MSSPDRIDLPHVPEAVRRALLAHWVSTGDCSRKTDPRWFAEAEGIAPIDIDDYVHGQRAWEALQAAGIQVEKPLSYGRYAGQGFSTFILLVGGEGRWALRVSEMGPSVDLYNHAGFRYQGPTLVEHVTGVPDELAATVAETLERAGFLVLSKPCLETKVEGLLVYCFRPDAELHMVDLLFYWQD